MDHLCHDHHQYDCRLGIFSWGRTVSIGPWVETEHLCVNASVYVETLSEWIWKQFSGSSERLRLTSQLPSSSSSSSDDCKLIFLENLWHILWRLLDLIYCGGAFVIWGTTSPAIIVLGWLHKFLPIFSLVNSHQKQNLDKFFITQFTFSRWNFRYETWLDSAMCIFIHIAGVKCGRYKSGQHQKPNTANHIPHWSQPIAANMTANLHSQ